MERGCFIPRNIYLHYSMNLSEEERKEAQGKLYYTRLPCGKNIMWDPEEEDFALFLTSYRMQRQSSLRERRMP